MTTHTCLAGIIAIIALSGCASTNESSAKTAGGSPPCLTSTGSRVPDPQTHCTGYGRSYSQADFDRTGKDTTAGALRQLDPSLTITH